MNMDNRVFNVNGNGSKGLLAALELVFLQDGSNTTCKGWKETKEHGLILYWLDKRDNNTSLPVPMNAQQCIHFVEAWLETDFAKTVELSDWCEDADHDGHNSEGWQVYCENWGKVGGSDYAICAIKPAFCWHGK